MFLQDQHTLRFVALLGADVFDAVLVTVAQVVKPQAVPVLVDKRFQLVLQEGVLRSIQQALKNRVLHPLAVIDTLPGYLPQTLAAGGVFSVHIVGDEYQHLIPLISRKMADIPPGPRGDTGPAAAPGCGAPAPRAAFPPGRDG